MDSIIGLLIIGIIIILATKTGRKEVSKLISKLIGKGMDKLKKQICNLLKIFLNAVIFMIKKIVINMLIQLKPSNLKQLLATKERYLFISLAIISLGLLLYKGYRFYICLIIGLLSYFLLKGVLISINDLIISTIKKKKIDMLCNKYKYICEMFDNRLQIVKEQQNILTAFSSDFTCKHLIDKKEILEIKLNRDINNISRQTGNFKYMNIVFKIDTKFKKFYRFQDYVACADTSKTKVPFLFGIKEDEALLVIDFAEIKHMLISGVTGGGKSNLINMILQSLFCFDNNVVCILVDFKYEIEMYKYSKFRNCVTVSNQKEFKKILDLLFEEMKDRAEILKKNNVSDINQYNKRFSSKKMPFIILVIDEIGDLKLDKEKSKDDNTTVIDKLKKLLTIARALGISVVMATQTPSGEILDTDIRRLVPFKISTNVGKAIETQKMTGVTGTQELKTAEFMTNFKKYSDIYKGLLIQEEADEEEGLPECNKIFEKLSNLMTKDNEYLENNKDECIIAVGNIIKQKSKKHKKNVNYFSHIYNLFSKILLTKINKGKGEVLAVSANLEKNMLIIKPFSNEVIDCVNRFKNLHDENKISLEKNTFSDSETNPANTDSRYLKFLNVIFQFRNEKNIIPSSKIINDYMDNFGEYERDVLLGKAKEENLIIANGTKFLINLNNEKWDNFLEGMI